MSELRERLNKVMNRLEELEKNPSELTKDALLADLRETYDAVKAFDIANVLAPVVEQKVEEQPVEPEPQTKPAPAPISVEEAPVAEPVAEVQAAPEPEVKPEPVAETPTPAPKEEKQPFIGKEEPKEKNVDQKILAGQLSRKPLEDLRTGIPLNEKFGIIRSLFKGNASDFGDAVLKLNNAASPTEMNHYLSLLQQRFGWDLESEAYQTFSVYVERKMLTLEKLDANTNQ